MPGRVVLGGTFNVIHRGHLALLRKAFEIGDFVFIGLTSDVMANDRRDVSVQPYEIREKNLMAAVNEIAKGKQFRIENIEDVYGPAATGEYDVIVVSEETLAGAEKINLVRERGGLKPLEIVVIGIVKAEDGDKIAARRIVRGEIDRDGNVK